MRTAVAQQPTDSTRVKAQMNSYIMLAARCMAVESFLLPWCSKFVPAGARTGQPKNQLGKDGAHALGNPLFDSTRASQLEAKTPPRFEPCLGTVICRTGL